jgi:hypothetical protein
MFGFGIVYAHFSSILFCKVAVELSRPKAKVMRAFDLGTLQIF